MLKRLINNFKDRLKNYIRGVANEQVKRPVELANPTIKIGKQVTLSDDSVLNSYTSIGDHCFINNTVIGGYTYLSFHVTVNNSIIGKFCSVAQGVSICLGNHPSSTFVSTSPVFFSANKQCGTTFADQTYFAESGRCTIGNDVWIGANAVIMDNVIVSDGAIVGAGSIVTKDIPAYAIVAGVPARIIKFRFDQEQIDFLLTFKWWDKDEDWIKANFKSFHDIQTFKAKNDYSAEVLATAKTQ